jgi:hypothetical protein
VSGLIADTQRNLIDVNNPSDVEYFNRLFTEGIDSLAFCKPLYIILLVKHTEILGFVTLGKTIMSIFEDIQYEAGRW